MFKLPSGVQIIQVAEKPTEPSKEIIFTPPAELPEATEGVSYSYSFCEPTSARSGATCGGLAGATTNPYGGNPPYSFSHQFGVGFIPPGLALELNGLLRGTPTLPGEYTFGVCVKDLSQEEVCRTTSLTVKLTVKPGWSGEWTSRVPGKGFVFQLNTIISYYDIDLSLVQKGNTVTGNLQMTLRNVVGAEQVFGEDFAKALRSNIGKTSTQDVSWAVSGNTVSWRTTLYAYDRPYPGDMYTLTLTGDTLYGTVTWNDEMDGSKRTSTFDLKRK